MLKKKKTLPLNHRRRDHKVCVSPAQMLFTLSTAAAAQTVLISCNSFSSNTGDRWGLSNRRACNCFSLALFFTALPFFSFQK